MRFPIRVIILFSCLLLAAAIGASTTAQQRDEAPILPVGGPAAATDLSEEGWCSDDDPGFGLARLSWAVADNPGSKQRVDVTAYRNGFQTGRYGSSEELPSDQDELVWPGVEPGINYYWRVLTLTDGGWVPSKTSRCEGPTCPTDRRPPPPPQ